MSAETSPAGEADSSNESDANSSTGCPTCGRDDFKNTHGMKIHHAEAHGESIAGVEMVCEYCSETYRVHPTHKEQTRFCSKDCLHKWRSENERGENHHAYDRITCDCEICGETVKRQRSQYERMDHVFCSQECHRKYQSRHQVGENHHNYGGGRAEKYGPNWDEQAEKCRERDDYTCQGCGLPQEEHFRALTGHHIRPRKEFIDSDGNYDYEEANRLENLVALCSACHQRWEGMPVKPTFEPSS